MEKQGKLIIVPVILEPCDWLNTPFKQFKAVPRDGKAVSSWENKNTAFLDIIQNLRNLTKSKESVKTVGFGEVKQNIPLSRNYRVEKDFDTIEKLHFAESGFHEIKDFLKRYIDEIVQLENIKAKVLNESEQSFNAIIVNRNKIATEANLSVTIGADNSIWNSGKDADKAINYSINDNRTGKGLVLRFDKFHLFWSQNNYHGNYGDKNEFSTKDIADALWNEWLGSVGIL